MSTDATENKNNMTKAIMDNNKHRLVVLLVE